MISISGVSSCAVAQAPVGNLVLLQIPGGWLNCLTVLRANSVTLLALGLKSPAGKRSTELLQGISEQHCVVLGKAEFRFELSSLSDKASNSHLMLGSKGPAILGKIDVPSMQMVESAAWLISNGETVPIERLVPFAEAWEVGVRNSAEFEKLLSFPFT